LRETLTKIFELDACTCLRQARQDGSMVHEVHALRLGALSAAYTDVMFVIKG